MRELRRFNDPTMRKGSFQQFPELAPVDAVIVDHQNY